MQHVDQFRKIPFQQRAMRGNRNIISVMPSELQKSRNFSMPLAVATTDGPFHTHKPCTVLDPCAAAEPRQPSTRAINNVAVRSRALEPIIELLSTSCLQLYPSFARTGENLAISSARVID